MRKALALGTIGVILVLAAILLTGNTSARNAGGFIFLALLWVFGISAIVFSLLAIIPSTKNVAERISGRIKKRIAKLDLSDASASQTQVMTNTIRAKNTQMSRMVTDLSKTIPEHAASHHFSPVNVKIAAIADEASYALIAGVVATSERFEPDSDALPVGDDWSAIWFICNRPLSSRARTASEKRIQWAHDHDIPVLLHFDGDDEHIASIQNIAQNAAAVFTPFAESVDPLRDGAGHERIYVDSFGVNPMVYNPVGSHRSDLKFAYFVGPYPSKDRHPSASKWIERDATDLLAAFSSRGRLLISDSNLTGATSSFPDRFSPYTMAPISGQENARVSKLFSYNISLTANAQSATGYDRSVDSLIGLGKSIVSNYSVALFNRAPLIRIIPAAVNAEGLLESRGRSDSDVLAQFALSEAMLKRNAFVRVTQMLSKVMSIDLRERPRRILVIGSGDMETVRSNFDRQLYRNADLIEERELKAADLDGYGYIAAMNSDYSYGPNYLSGRFAAFTYTGAKFATQVGGYTAKVFQPGLVHEKVDHAVDRFVTMVSTTSPEAINFATGGTSRLQADGYAVDHYEVNYDMYVGAEARKNKQDLRLSVIIPIYNNGRFLFSKALPSLRINKSWPEMEVILIDDGSTDPFTLRLCSDLAQTYPNIKYFAFSDGGSGSASRPRNKGMELATAPLVTYLDPDNEISMFGYDLLLDQYDKAHNEDPDIEFVSGYQLKVTSWRGATGRHAPRSRLVVKDFKEHFFAKGDFPVVSTQCAVISRDFLNRENLRFIENAIGQDTLFGWELILKARGGVFVDNAYLIYYADRADSVTNAVGKKYFSRVLINEIEKERVLRENGILDIYKESHMPGFIKNWYLPRLGRVPDDEYAEARADLERIVQLYGHDLSEYETADAGE